MITGTHLPAAAAGGLAVATSGSRVRTAPAAAPLVDMELLVKAAQIDPRRPDRALTPGAKESVLLVERALMARGLLTAGQLDGHFGTGTIAAYAAYQRSLGYSGPDATGLPGRASLRLLGERRFTVTRMLTTGARVTLRGARVNARTRSMLLEAERLFGRPLGITQGSYTPGAGRSAGAHGGGGVLRLSVGGMSATAWTAVLRSLRTVGFAAWLRTPAQGNWPYHIQAIALADTDQSTDARNQAGDYYLGLNGLANRGRDDGPAGTPKQTWEEYRRA
ncbi:MAG TPA: peptidoglycan-binding domain-containing protein [Pseudonocardiaceae bacterium]